jgi:hypothetical protein
MIKESSWVHEVFYQEKKRRIEVFPLGIQLYSEVFERSVFLISGYIGNFPGLGGQGILVVKP